MFIYGIVGTVEYFDVLQMLNGNGGWVSLPDDVNIWEGTELAGIIRLGARIKIEQTVDDTTKPIYVEKECVIKTTTGSVSEEVTPAEKE